jgi:hypothetical protein
MILILVAFSVAQELELQVWLLTPYLAICGILGAPTRIFCRRRPECASVVRFVTTHDSEAIAKLLSH